MTKLFHRFGLAVGLPLLALLAGCGSDKPVKSAADESSKGGGGHAEVGKPAPDLSIQTLNGKGKVSIEGSQGKVLIVDFWATWCGPCKQSFPKLEELQKKMGDKVEILGISVDDEKKGVLEFAKENGATFAIGWDEGHTIAERWKVGSMPTTFIVDANGKVRHIHDGYHDGETKTMEKEIIALGEEPKEKVAKNDSSSDKDKEKDKDKAEKKDEGEKHASKDSDKSEKSSDKTEATDAAGDEEAPPPPPKKKGGKKGGGKGGGGKGAPKKGTKKKV